MWPGVFGRYRVSRPIQLPLYKVVLVLVLLLLLPFLSFRYLVQAHILRCMIAPVPWHSSGVSGCMASRGM